MIVSDPVEADQRVATLYFNSESPTLWSSQELVLTREFRLF